MENSETPVSPDVINHTFARTIKNLKTEKLLDFKTDSQTINNKTRTYNKLKLYNLRKYFRNNNHADWDYKNFWMAHISKLGADRHYIDTSTTPENIEKHREIYRQKAMPYLKLETPALDETTQIIIDLQDKLEKQEKQRQKEIEIIENKHKQENEELKNSLTEQNHVLNLILDILLEPMSEERTRSKAEQLIEIMKQRKDFQTQLKTQKTEK
jgi:histidyl-tRNA synthetase